MQHTMFAEETLNPQIVVEQSSATKKRSSKYLSVDVLRDQIRGMFPSFSLYREYVVKHNLVKHGFPLNIRSAYGNDLTIDEFLGNPEGTYSEWQRNRTKEHKPWIIGTAVRQQQIRQRKHEEIQEELKAYDNAKLIAGLKKDIANQNVSVSTEHSFSIDDVCKYLLSRDMTNTVLNIMNEGKITVHDARIISNHIFQYYEAKQKTLVK